VTDFGHCPSSQALTNYNISENGYGLLDAVRETLSKDLQQYVLSLSFLHLKTETDPFTEMLCFLKPETMEMFDTPVTSI
jgi:hypothetical protein